jgi:hypothetical protein
VILRVARTLGNSATEPVAGLRFRDLFAIMHDACRPKGDHPEDRLQKRGLPGPVVADDGYHLTRSDRKADAAQNLLLTVARHERIYPQERLTIAPRVMRSCLSSRR